MKYCLSSRQSAEYLQKADEIKVLYRDIEQIYDLMDKYENKNIILNIIYWKSLCISIKTMLYFYI